MGLVVCFERVRTARKAIPCDACRTLVAQGFDYIDVPRAHWPALDAATRDRGMIAKGTRYLYVGGFWNGRPGRFRARLDVDRVCRLNHLYDLPGERFHGQFSTEETAEEPRAATPQGTAQGAASAAGTAQDAGQRQPLYRALYRRARAALRRPAGYLRRAVAAAELRSRIARMVQAARHRLARTRAGT